MNLNIYIHKDAQEGAPDVALKGTLLVALELHLFMQLSMHKSVQNDSTFSRVIQDALEGDKKGAFDVALDGALEGAFVGALYDAIEGSSEDMPHGVLQDLYKDAQERNLRLKLRVDFR